MSTPYDLHSGLGYQLTIAARTNNAGFEKALTTLGLTRQMWCVLVAVGEQNITAPSDIAEYIGIIRPALSRTLTQMEHKAMLRRTGRKGDKRSTEISLTSYGQKTLKASLPLAYQTREPLNRALTDAEQKQLTTLLAKLTSASQHPAPGV